MERRSNSLIKLSSINNIKSNSNLKTKFKVVVKIRPAEVGTEYESDLYNNEDLTKVVVKVNEHKIKLKRPNSDDRFFMYDKILKDSETQEDTFNSVALDITNDVTKGYNGTVLAYGQTGSGKTYTIFGIEESLNLHIDKPVSKEAGIVPRSVKILFNYLRESALNKDIDNKLKFKFKVSVSFFQIYMEHITDLIPDFNKVNTYEEWENNINSSNNYNTKKGFDFNVKNQTNNLINKAKKEIGEGLKLREDPKTGVFIQDLKKVTVENEEQLLSLIKFASKNRITTNTNMNQSSSRSHAILRILFEQRIYEENNDNNVNYNNDLREEPRTSRKTLSGLLSFVDLAGSEKSKMSSDGIRFEETKYINSSLYHLGSVISSLANNSKEASFRSSILTRILQDCLCGNSKTSICATVSPFLMNYDETLTTLQFANKAIRISNITCANEKIEIKNLKSSIQKIMQESLLNTNTLNNASLGNILQIMQIKNALNNQNNNKLLNNSNYYNYSKNKQAYNKNYIKARQSYSNINKYTITGELENNNQNTGYNNINSLNLFKNDVYKGNNINQDIDKIKQINKNYYEIIQNLQDELVNKELQILGLKDENSSLKEALTILKQSKQKADYSEDDDDDEEENENEEEYEDKENNIST